jgi:asparagine synthetase B (glutamine-hydrolysing)
MTQIKTAIIPSKPTFAKRRAPHELDKEAICIFTATGFFLDTDTYFKDLMVLPPASICELDTEGYFIRSRPWFDWHHTPRKLHFDQALEEFSILFESIIEEQVGDKKVILPLSGGLDSRTQATALQYLGKDVNSYSYDFEGGYPETAIAKKIANVCDFNFTKYHVKKGYLWHSIEELAQLNQCYSEFTHPRQFAFIEAYSELGEIFSLGHWGDVLFDGTRDLEHAENDLVAHILKKILKKGGMELANTLWEEWQLDGTFESYLRQRVSELLDKININDNSAKVRAFKSMCWAPRWTAINLSIFEAKHPISLPYFDDRMCEFVCTIPEEFLLERKLQIAYIKHRNPELAKITWEQQSPFNLYNFQQNKSPNNLPYRAIRKMKREIKSLLGQPYVQRNWELQFTGSNNDSHLRSYLFSEGLKDLVSADTIRFFYENFKNKDAVKYSHPVSMLLTLSLKMKQLSSL